MSNNKDNNSNNVTTFQQSKQQPMIDFKISLDDLITKERFSKIIEQIFSPALTYQTLTLNHIQDYNQFKLELGESKAGFRQKQKRDSSGLFNTDYDALKSVVNDIIEKFKSNTYKKYSDLVYDLSEIIDSNSLNIMSKMTRLIPFHFPLKTLQSLLYNQPFGLDTDTDLIFKFFNAISQNKVTPQIKSMKKLNHYDIITDTNKEFFTMDIELHSRNAFNHILAPLQLNEFGIDYLFELMPQYKIVNEYGVQQAVGLKRESTRPIYLFEFNKEKIIQLINDYNNGNTESINYYVVGMHTQPAIFEDFINYTTSEFSKIQQSKKYSNMSLK